MFCPAGRYTLYTAIIFSIRSWNFIFGNDNVYYTLNGFLFAFTKSPDNVAPTTNTPQNDVISSPRMYHPKTVFS
jgi:hypothetical protein